ncbi:NAD(P)-dependent dehydrogenase, short-chain alcohol dehydrogenase family [Chitinophaga jiangningensis]|uniref:NAD(P)-dependent dehydrogenase, short-chain alcohol dehydrogenase family n=1 Tax=Chitinophaga jiangningensis TaxID=1419482 RepID=A0A1M7L9Z2_9BACT|nr:SDR family oxidoreductase [Chitinophaga jiangningensis]SHM74741.1 NAD(P)-dependent dehydrogenase, short-chain alcohol dehydrogenase family [Chitinophaga jiangningensis]
MKKLTGKTALVTGGNSGIGYAAAQELVAQGATVIITGRRVAALSKAAAEIGAAYFVADQSSMDDINTLVAAVKKQYGQLDILFVNAGITGNQMLIADATEENFDQVMNINFKGAYFTLSKFVPVLADGASVVMLSSIVANMYKPMSSMYQASKAALNSIAKTAAAELAARKIRVNIVSPGPTRTEVLTKTGADQQAVEAIYEHLESIIPLRQIGTAGDVAKMVAYLCDDAAGFITGAEFVIDGGLTI